MGEVRGFYIELSSSSRGWKRENERDEAGAEPAAARWRGRRRSWRAGTADRLSRLAIVGDERDNCIFRNLNNVIRNNAIQKI
jgi:hypothetical protein